jgi:hypothetical protein
MNFKKQVDINNRMNNILDKKSGQHGKNCAAILIYLKNSGCSRTNNHIYCIENQASTEKLPHAPKKVGAPTKRWKDIQTGYNLRPRRKTSQSHEEESAH